MPTTGTATSSRPSKSNKQTRSNSCCSMPPNKPWRMPATIAVRSTATGWGSSWEPCLAMNSRNNSISPCGCRNSSKRCGALLLERGFAAGDIDRLAARFEKLLIQRMPALVDETGSFTSSTLASRITKSFDFFGGGLALDAGEAAGLAALTASADFLLHGYCDAVVCAAGDRNMGLLVYEAEALSGRLALGEPQSLFSATTKAVFRARVSACCCSSACRDARRDGDPIRGILRGFGAGAGDDLYQASRLAMRRALRDAHVEPRQIAALESASAGAARRRSPACGGHRRNVWCGPSRRAVATRVRWSARSAIPRPPPAWRPSSKARWPWRTPKCRPKSA